MGRKIFITHIFLLFLTLCVGESSDDIQLSTSTSVSVSTVTRKVTSKSDSRPNASKSSGNETLPTKDGAIRIFNENGGASLNFSEGAVIKSQKIRKKILASNFKNISERVVSARDSQNLLKSIVNVTEVFGSKDSEKRSASNSTQDGLPENFVIKSENVTVSTEIPGNKSLSEGSERKDNGGAIEGRSLEDRSSEENVNVNFKEKVKLPLVTTERSTNSFIYESVGDLPKVLNNNFLNSNEGREQKTDTKAVHHSPAVILPTSKSTSISGDSSLKNAIRFESEYYGPTGQTDWIPIIPDQPPVRSASSSQQFGSRVRQLPREKFNKTTERNTVAFPSDGVHVRKISKIVPAKEKEVEKTTIRLRNIVEKQSKLSNTTDTWRPIITHQPTGLIPKSRGGIRYKSSHSNSNPDEKKSQNETILKRSNFSLGMEIPVTGATWTLATLGEPKNFSGKSEETTEISVVTVVSSTNHTTKSQNAVYSGLIVPPENVKNENATKEQETLKNIIPGTTLEETVDSVSKNNDTEVSNILPRLVESWVAKNGKYGEQANETDVIIPKSIEVNQSNESSFTLKEKHVVEAPAPELKTTVVVATTEATESFPYSISPTENSVFEKVSSQSSLSNSSVGKPLEVPLTMISDKLHTPDEIITETFTKEAVTPTAEIVTLPTTLRSGSFEEVIDEDIETSTEVKHTTVSVEAGNIAEESGPPHQKAGGLVTHTVTTVPPTSLVAANTTTATTTTSASTPLPFVVAKQSVTTSISKESFPNANGTTPKTTATPFQVMNTTVATSLLPNATESSQPSKIDPITTTTTTASTSEVPITSLTSSASTTTSTTASTTASTTVASTTTTPKTIISTTTTEVVHHKTLETNSETTEEGIFYKNYIPTTVNPHEEITEETVPAYLRLTVQAASWQELCRLKEDLRESIIKMLGGKNVSAESIHFLNLNEKNCLEKIEQNRRGLANGTVFLPVNMFLMDKNRDFDKNLSEAFLTTWGRRGLDFELPIRKVDFVTPIVNLTELADAPLGGSVVAAIVISCVAGICVILLGILFVIMKRRQKRFNYGQRCTPVSLDAYSLDSVSIYNSVRRKGMRASKRSYGNAAFDDPEVPTHPMNFAGLANFSTDKEQLYEEFNIIPQVCPKVEELPAGAETKNRYANVIPLPETRVHLAMKDGDPLSDYINANYVRGFKGAEKLYIACQAPMESTIDDFWRMVWEQQCKVVLMVTDLQENGIEKCADYLPPNEVTDNLRLFGDFQVTLKKRDVKEKYIISNLVLKNMDANLWREVTHLWYLGWPDQGVPSEANSLIAFLIEARSQMKIQNGATTSSPAVVHCSPGTGRTGTVIACDLCIREYEQSRMVDIPKCVFNLRRDRAGAVQTKDQYAFIYQVLNVYATKLSGGGIESI